MGALRLLEAIRLLGLTGKTRFYQASTSELYGNDPDVAPERDDAVLSAQPLRRGQALRLLDHRELPRSLRNPRLQRHPVQPREPLRGETFVTRKITRAAAAIHLGFQDKLATN